MGSSSSAPITRSVCLPDASNTLNAGPPPASPVAPSDPEPASSAPGRATVVDEDCGALDYHGQCRGAVAEWCDDGHISRVDCGSQGQTCGYVNASVGYYCQEDSPTSTTGNSALPTSTSRNGGLCTDTSLALSDHADPCPEVVENTWRCACSAQYETVISQVCRGGSWTTYHTDPNDCSRCDGRYTAGCDGH